MQDIKSSPDNQTSNISTQFFSPKSSVFTRLYSDFHQRNFIQKTQEVVTPQKSVKQEDKYRTKHLMAHIIRRHKEAQDRINELREQKEKELDQFDFKPKILKASREILKKIQQSNQNIQKKPEHFIQDPLLKQDTSKISEKQESEDFQCEKETLKQSEICPPIQSSKEQQKQKKANQNHQDLDGSELFKNLIEQRKTYFRSLQLHYPGVSIQPCKKHVPECYVNLNNNTSIPPYDPFSDINTNSVEQPNEIPSNIGKLNDSALTKTMTQRHDQNWEMIQLKEENKLNENDKNKDKDKENEPTDKIMKVVQRNEKWFNSKMQKIQQKVEQKEIEETKNNTFNPQLNSRCTSLKKPRIVPFTKNPQNSYKNLFQKKQNYKPPRYIRSVSPQPKKSIDPNQLFVTSFSGKTLTQRDNLLKQLQQEKREFPLKLYQSIQTQKSQTVTQRSNILSTFQNLSKQSSPEQSKKIELEYKTIKAKNAQKLQQLKTYEIKKKVLISPHYSQLSPQTNDYSFQLGFDIQTFISRAIPLERYKVEKKY